MGFEWAVQSSDYYVSIYCQFHDVFVYTVWRCSWVAMLVLCIYCTAIFPQRLLVLAKQAARFLNYCLDPVVAAKALEDHLHSSYG